LRWFGRVKRRMINAPNRKSKLIQVGKVRGRPIITLVKVGKKKDMSIREVTKFLISNE